MRKITLTILVMLAGACPVRASSITIDSGHYTWTDSDPYYDEVFVQNDANLDFLSGSIGKLETDHQGLANIYGGNMTSLWTFDDSVVTIHSGDLDILAAFNDSQIYLYTDDFIYNPTGGMENYGYIEGLYYGTTTAFYISFYDDTSYSHLTTIPEPATLLLFGLGGLLLRSGENLSGIWPAKMV